MGKGSCAKPKPAKETKAEQPVVEQQLVVAHAEKVEKQQVVACEKKVGHKQVGCPADVQAEVKMSYERYLEIGYKELERLTLENYSLSASAALGKFGKFVYMANIFRYMDAWKRFL